jgi:hypothetical protein
MSLEIPNLDDRRWADLVEEARSLIPRVAPLWTDHNAHDPGITFIELFAWLAEMQLYQLNRVGQRHREVFSQLVGVKRRLRKPAQVDVWVEGKLNAGIFLPAGTQLSPLEGEEIIFETQKDIFLSQSQLQRVITVAGTDRIDQTKANDKLGIVFLAFGESAQKDAELRLGFDAFYPANEPTIRLTASVFTDDLVGPCSLNVPTEQTEDQNLPGPFVDIVWEYLAAGNHWLPLEFKDETGAFTRNGAITLAVPKDAVPEDAKMFWIRARIRQRDYDIEPRLRSISLNVLPCAQVETVLNEELGPVTGRPNQTFKLAKTPILVREAGSRAEIVSSDVANWEYLVKEIQQLPPARAEKFDNLRALPAENSLFEYERIKELNRVLSAAADNQNESPTRDQSVDKTPELDHLVGSTPIVIAVADEPWRPVLSFEKSDPTSKHYVFDSEQGTVEFGNGLNGQIPMPGQAVRAVWYQASHGVSGNVSKELRWRFRNTGIPGVTLTNPEPAAGGTDPEPLDQMELRAQALLSRPQRAVTLSDLELLTLSTPHARVARAKAITDCPVPESITVVAVPKIRPGRKGPPKEPSKLFLEMVHRHLQRSRLLCDSLRVIGPVYIEVKVSAHLRIERGAAPLSVIERAREALDRFLRGELEPADQKLLSDRDSVRNASTQSPCFTRWPFGRRVFPSEVYAVLDAVPGVDFASNLMLSASRGDAPIKTTEAGAIPLPPAGLVYAGPHDLTAETEPGRNG